jgi:hypothetical protein
MAIQSLDNNEINAVAGSLSLASLNSALATLTASANSFYTAMTNAAATMQSVLAKFVADMTRLINSLPQ